MKKSKSQKSKIRSRVLRRKINNFECNVKYDISHWFRRNFRPAITFYQRGKRGWADEDTWSIDATLSKIIPEMLRYLADNGNGTPCGYGAPSNSTSEEIIAYDRTNNGRMLWKKDLHHMADLFQDACPYTSKHENPYIDKIGWCHDSPFTPKNEEAWKKYKEWETNRFKEGQKSLHEACVLLEKNYYNLWD